MMTASWGCLGWLWNKPVAVVFIRPERFTHEFIEANDTMTLSFLGHSEEARKIYNFCGSKSGRDLDKCEATGLKPVVLEGGSIGFEQARLCRQKSLSTKTFCSGMVPRVASTMCMWWKSLMPTPSKTIKKTHSLLATKQPHLNYGTRTNSSKRTSGS